MKRAVIIIGVALCIGCAAAFSPRTSVERFFLSLLGDDSRYEAVGQSSELHPLFIGQDTQRHQLTIRLTEIAQGLSQPVDLLFPPHQPELMLVAEKVGQVSWIELKRPQNRGVFLQEKRVVTEVEQGLLGIALHPQFIENGRLFINATVKREDGREFTEIAEWVVDPSVDLRSAHPRKEKVILAVEQPYQNHNAGQLAFGPDGMLYIGFGDGGLADDPRAHGQNMKTMLGSIVRLDVDSPPLPGESYVTPHDNPFVGHDEALPEIWALGFRNPWRYSFAPDGRLIVADVGQNKWEEVSVVRRGENHGWNIREADHCFSPKKDCQVEGMTDPLYSYSHQEGSSITGGYVYTGKEITSLYERYIFADFTSGRMWAIPLPQTGERLSPKQVISLGKWPLLISTFGRDQEGNLYLADFAAGRVFKISLP